MRRPVLRNGVRAWLKSAFADRRGAAFVEFAFIAPVLLLLALGMSDLSPALMGEFHVDHANESTADMAAALSPWAGKVDEVVLWHPRTFNDTSTVTLTTAVSMAESCGPN